jgi:hypothetical protein
LDAEMLRGYIFGEHIADYMRELQEDDEEAYKRQFSRFVAADVSADDLEDMYSSAHSAIRENPEMDKKAKSADELKKLKASSMKHKAVCSAVFSLCSDAFCVDQADVRTTQGEGRGSKGRVPGVVAVLSVPNASAHQKKWRSNDFVQSMNRKTSLNQSMHSFVYWRFRNAHFKSRSFFASMLCYACQRTPKEGEKQ